MSADNSRIKKDYSNDPRADIHSPAPQPTITTINSYQDCYGDLTEDDHDDDLYNPFSAEFHDDLDEEDFSFHVSPERQADELTPWFNFFTLFARPRTEDKQSSSCAAQRPQPTSLHPTDLKALSKPAVLTLTPETHTDLSQILNHLLNALRSHAITLFRNRELAKDEIWELNKKLTQFLDLVKHLMPLQSIPRDKVKAFQEHYEAQKSFYDKIMQEYQNKQQTMSLFDEWKEKIAAKVESVFALLDSVLKQSAKTAQSDVKRDKPTRVDLSKHSTFAKTATTPCPEDIQLSSTVDNAVDEPDVSQRRMAPPAA